MSSLLYRINSVLSRVVAGVPLGTNLGLFHLLWMLLSGRLLQSRGAVIRGSPILGLLRMPSGAAGLLWRMAVAPLPVAWSLGELSARKAAFRHTNMGAIARSRVTWSASFVHVFRTARPSTTRPQRAKRYRPFPWALRPVSGRSARSVWPCPASWYGARGPRRAKPLCKPACSKGSRRSWPTTKRSSAIGAGLAQIQVAGMPRYVSRGPINFTARRAVLPAYQGKGAHRGGERSSASPASVQAPHHGRATRPHETWQSGAPKAPPAPCGVLGWSGARRRTRRAPRRSVRRSSMIHALTSRCC